MSPRAYNRTGRRESVDETRRRIFEAARQLLSGSSGQETFSVDAVAREAGVARATVYYQLGSRAGLIEAFFDHLAQSASLVAGIGMAMSNADPAGAVAALISAFHGFWGNDRTVLRRIRAMGALDAELGELLAARNGRRKHLAAVILDRATGAGYELALPREDAVDLLWTLSDFEIYDTLAESRPAKDVTEMLVGVAMRSLFTDRSEPTAP